MPPMIKQTLLHLNLCGPFLYVRASVCLIFDLYRPWSILALPFSSVSHSKARLNIMNSSSWESVAQNVQEYRDVTLDHVEPPIPEVPSPLPQNSIDLARTLLSDREIDITETSTKDLISSLASVKFSSIEVTNAFLRRAGLAQKLV